MTIQHDGAASADECVCCWGQRDGKTAPAHRDKLCSYCADNCAPDATGCAAMIHEPTRGRIADASRSVGRDPPEPCSVEAISDRLEANPRDIDALEAWFRHSWVCHPSLTRERALFLIADGRRLRAEGEKLAEALRDVATVVGTAKARETIETALAAWVATKSKEGA